MEVTFKSTDDKPEDEPGVEESMGFEKYIQELKELRSQLHNAADYCESTFLKSQEKKPDVLESTKEYICKSVVTVIDHLGNVSANFEGLISKTNAFSEAELRIQCLKQRLQSCEHYARQFTLAKMQYSDNLPRLHSRYLSSTPTLDRSSSEKPRDSESQIPSKMKDKHVQATHDDLPLFMYTDKPHPFQILKPTTATVKGHNNFVTVVPVGDDLSVLTKVPNATFHFQSTQKVGNQRRSLHGRDILWLMRRTKRTH
ncbi:putative ABI family protein [Lupinus albus]|uniref:Putative ABI family protein n=1 Tax=Lupinus albus TaxID=3870 RepID=A0A6A4QJZ6_LUPAL|nr:putative ABI family protein [Lupinus albus]